MADILFADKKHEELFYSLFKKMNTHDCYHGSAAYLLGLDTVLREHIKDVFDFSEDVIKPDGLHKAWQTGTSRKTTRLLFNLWNGMYKDEAAPKTSDYEDEDEDQEEDETERLNYSPRYYAADNIFSCSYAPYFVQAMKLRFPEYF